MGVHEFTALHVDKGAEETGFSRSLRKRVFFCDFFEETVRSIILPPLEFLTPFFQKGRGFILHDLFRWYDFSRCRVTGTGEPVQWIEGELSLQGANAKAGRDQ